MEDNRFIEKFNSFLEKLQKMSCEVSEAEVKEMIASIMGVFEQHHITYNQAREMLSLVEDALTLQSSQVRM